MSDDLINEAFVEVLKNKIPKKTQLADFIAEALSVEKETAYRRLRGVTMFTFGEVITLAKKLNISIDEISIDLEKTSPVTNMMMRSYYDESKPEDAFIEQSSSVFLRQFVKQPNAEFGTALRSIPYQLLLEFDGLSRYYKFKYIQHAGNPISRKSFKEIQLKDSDIKNTEDAFFLFQDIPYSIYIWDKKIIPIVVDDIHYFHSLGFMDDRDVKLLKKELLHFITKMEDLIIRGRFERTGNKVDIYISDEDIDSTYTYFTSSQLCMSMLITHLSYIMMSFNNKSKCKETIDWITSMKFNSTLISGTGGKERVLFLNQQRKVINTL